MSKRVYLKPGKETRVFSGHPWVFRSDVDRAEKGVSPGDVVAVTAARGTFLGQAVYNPASMIALRMLTASDEPVDARFIQGRVREALALRRQLGSLDCGRLVFAESDRLPAVIADNFGGVVSLQILSLGMARFGQAILETLVDELRPRGVYARNDVSVRALEGMEMETGVLYGTVPEQVEIEENGLRLMVDVKRGQKTGYFLDQKENRAAIAPYCPGARVLDVCTHTGSFALHAMMYGAGEATGVDISETAVAAARANAALNGYPKAAFTAANAFDDLRARSDRGERYSLVVLDPPAFAKNKASLPGATKGYKEINLRAMKMLEDGGVLVTCSCSQAMLPELFTDMLRAAARDAGVTLQQLEWRGQSRDHPVLPAAPETHYLKCGVFRVLR